MAFIIENLLCLEHSSGGTTEQEWAANKNETFCLFFQIFFLVVMFGLFYGTMFLPVLLSLIGPKPYESLQATAPQPEEMKVYSPCNAEEPS